MAGVRKGRGRELERETLAFVSPATQARSGVTSCSNIIIKNAEIKFKNRTRKINLKRTDDKLLWLEISISLKK